MINIKDRRNREAIPAGIMNYWLNFPHAAPKEKKFLTHRTCRRVYSQFPIKKKKPRSVFVCSQSKCVQRLEGESNSSADNGSSHAADAEASGSVGSGSSRLAGGGAGAARGGSGGEDLTTKHSGLGRLVGGDLLGGSLEVGEGLVGVGVDSTNHAGTTVVAG